jgi:peptidoglycan/LPS O-acetylase OafA/YrhL
MATDAPRRTGLDGLRALAVAAVVAFHLDEGALPGGVLGVDVFFVLSGYLITGLLLAEWDPRGGVDLRAFWRRRARRLLPPLGLALIGVALVTPIVYADVAERVHGQLLAAVAQGGNWFEVVAGRSYFEGLGRPSPLVHLWSLGVEAQFYALWPLLVLLALRRGGHRTLLLVAGAGAVASFVAMAVLFQPGQDPSRLYYGTDTRAGALLVGAVLAVVLPAHRLRRDLALGRTLLLDALGIAGLAGLGALAVSLDGSTASTYRGGLALAAVLAAAAVAAAAHPASHLGRVLGAGPLVWLGTRSYAVYLWHWPVIVATLPGIDVALHGRPLLAARIGATLLLAEASTRLVEAALRPRGRRNTVPVRRVFVPTVAAIVFAVGLSTAAPASPAAPAFFVSPTTTVEPATTSTAAPTTTTTTAAVAPTTTVVPTTTTTTTTPPPPAPAGPAVAVGESVLLGAGGAVQRALGPGTVVDAEIGRQPDDVLDALEGLRRAGRLDGVDTVVVQMGSNGLVGGREIDRLASLVAGVRRVVVITVRVDRPWQDPSNAAFRDAAGRHPWLRLADWNALASAHPELLGPDGVHPTPDGVRQYADLVGWAARTP